MIEKIGQKSPEEAPRLKKGDTVYLREDLPSDFYEKLTPVFMRSVPYKVFGYDGEKNSAWIGPPDASEEDIDDFSVSEWMRMDSTRFKQVGEFDPDMLVAVH